MEEAREVKSSIPAPDTKSWYEHIWKEQQQTPARLEEAAKFLAGMVSISLSIFIAVGKDALENSGASCWIKVSILSWLVSLLLSFLVLFPWRYRFSSQSVQTIKNANKKIVRVKGILLLASLVLFMAALTILAIIFFF